MDVTTLLAIGVAVSIALNGLSLVLVVRAGSQASEDRAGLRQEISREREELRSKLERLEQTVLRKNGDPALRLMTIHDLRGELMNMKLYERLDRADQMIVECLKLINSLAGRLNEHDQALGRPAFVPPGQMRS